MTAVSARTNTRHDVSSVFVILLGRLVLLMFESLSCLEPAGRSVCDVRCCERSASMRRVGEFYTTQAAVAAVL